MPKQSDRHERGERARAVQEVDLHRQRVDQMGQRQPDGADLLPARRDVVDDAARDDEMRLGVVVAEDEVRSQKTNPRSERRQLPGAARTRAYNHERASGSCVHRTA